MGHCSETRWLHGSPPEHSEKCHPRLQCVRLQFMEHSMTQALRHASLAPGVQLCPFLGACTVIERGRSVRCPSVRDSDRAPTVRLSLHDLRLILKHHSSHDVHPHLCPFSTPLAICRAMSNTRLARTRDLDVCRRAVCAGHACATLLPPCVRRCPMLCLSDVSTNLTPRCDSSGPQPQLLAACARACPTSLPLNTTACLWYGAPGC